MVQQMVDNFSKYRMLSSGSAVPAGDKQHSVSVKKVALRELPNESRNIMIKPTGTSPLPKEKRLIPDSVKVVGTKRPQPADPSSPSGHQNPGNIGPNGHLVYVRRKLETEQGKMSTFVSTDSAGSPDSRKSGNNRTKEQNVQQCQTQEPKAASLPVPVTGASAATSSGEQLLPHCPGKIITELAAPEPHDSMVTSITPVLADPERLGNQDWNERFNRLQMFLNSCDQSSQEEYVRSRELHRMKVLNVLGKALPRDHTSISTQTPSPPQEQFRK
ncbi:uncharacterized protein [Elaeis guineensis]|uniref:Uncharacterized protein LOC105059700 isoform X2 n=1 Tax=Elaeis guineensis var. tenera TaxID=51953 RepID=A0A6I9SCD8_ELAGV|nr:uncharacterized protein LOC105059700 isoform X2 [Elaeis guineensis]